MRAYKLLDFMCKRSDRARDRRVLLACVPVLSLAMLLSFALPSGGLVAEQPLQSPVDNAPAWMLLDPRLTSHAVDLVPEPMPTKMPRSADEESAVAKFDRAVDLLPLPETNGGRDAGSRGLDEQDDLLSPSDVTPREGESDAAAARPSRLGADSAAAPKQPSLLNTKPTSEHAKTPDRSAAGEKDRDDRHPDSILDASSDPRYPNAPHWTGLIEDERNRWAAPAGFRPYQAPAQVVCSGCGGCVDRRGNGALDKLGVHVGVGSREIPACQCWRCPHAAPFNLYGPGGYVGPARSARLPEYRLRAGDQVQLTFMIKTVRTVGAYRLVVGDELLIESDADVNLTRGTLDRGLEIQPDGTLTLRFIGQIHAAGQTIEQLRDLLNDRYEEFYPDPAIDVTPVKTGNVARQIREAISGSEGFNPQQTLQTVTPEGTLRLPRLGAIPTQGLTLGELKHEINLRYDSLGAGLEVEVTLDQQAPHYVYVLGEVTAPGRFAIDAPTTILGSLSLAGSYVPGANLRQVVVFRRGPNWELISTMLDLRAALLGGASQPLDEIWVQDGDVIIVPPAPIRLFDRFVRQVFTEGIYGIVPFGGVSISLGKNNR